LTLTILVLLSSTANVLSSSVEDRLRTAFDRVINTPKEQIDKSFIPAELEILLPYARHLNLKEPKPLPREARDLLCSGCIVAAEAVIDLFLIGADMSLIEEAAQVVCDLFNIEDHDVCAGAIHNYVPQLEYIFSARRVTGQEVCAIVLGNGCGNASHVNDWQVEMPSIQKPDVIPPSPPPDGAPSRKILHISDVHLDLSYEIGALAACDLPNCCMNITGPADNPEDAAMYWGDYRCDLPSWTFRHMLEHIKQDHGEEFEYIIITGDYPAHDVWLQSRENNLAHTKTVVDAVKEVFPTKPVFPSMGNHESFPCNNYPTSNVAGYDNPDWLYSKLGEFFVDWLPAESLEQFKVDGFYTVTYGDLKLIGINSNMCLTYNFFLFLEYQDPSAELAWLVEELLMSEAAGQKVHILSHIPPGNGDCLGAWGREFSKIINRFEGTVAAQFYGHTHNDEFMIFYDEVETSRAVSFGFVAPSVTTYTGLNPAYRIYTVDAGYEGASHRVLESETYIFNMDSANIAGPDVDPSWYKLYTATQDLGMESLLPQEWDKLVRRMAVDDDLFNTFGRFFNQDSYGDNLNRYSVLCPLLTTSNLDKSKCEEILGPQPIF